MYKEIVSGRERVAVVGLGYVWLDDSLSTGIEIYVYDVNPKYNGTFDETGFENTSDLFLSHTYKIFDEDRFYNFIGVK
jgi:hypothetical protein